MPIHFRFLLALSFLAAGGLRAGTVVQAFGRDFIAFQAELAEAFSESATVRWAVVPDPDASGGRSMLASGDSLGNPAAIATYRLRFSSPGSYVLYSRWKSDSAAAGENPFGANSFSYPRAFGDSPVWARSLANERVVPESLVYDWTQDNIQYEISAADVAAGRDFTFRIGTREGGLFLDRIVLKRGTGATAASLDVLPDSPDATRVPRLIGALAGDDLQSVRLSFSLPLAGVEPGNFAIENLAVSSAALDPSDPSFVTLATAAQDPGAFYAVAASELAGTDGAPVAPGSSAPFRAAQVLTGWVELRSNGATQFLRSFDCAVDGAEGPLNLTGFFIPESTTRYAFFSRNTGPATLALSVPGAETPLAAVSVEEQPVFGTNALFVTGVLTAGSNYVLTATLESAGASPALLSVAARPAADLGDVSPLAGGQVATLLNPERTGLRFVAQPAALSVSGGQSAQFHAAAEASRGPIFYQWQRNETDLPGATNQLLVTPPLNAGHSGERYRVIAQAAGQTAIGESATVTVNPGALVIARGGTGASVSWNAGAVGATLESTASLAQPHWKSVEGHDPIASPGSYAASEEAAAQFFRLRK